MSRGTLCPLWGLYVADHPYCPLSCKNSNQLNVLLCSNDRNDLNERRCLWKLLKFKCLYQVYLSKVYIKVLSKYYNLIRGSIVAEACVA